MTEFAMSSTEELIDLLVQAAFRSGQLDGLGYSRATPSYTWAVAERVKLHEELLQRVRLTNLEANRGKAEA